MPSPSLAARVLTGTAAARYAAASYAATTVPTARERQMLSRFTGGYTAADLKRLRKAGGVQEWFEQQLHPGKITESSTASALPSWYPELGWTPAQKFTNSRNGTRAGWLHARDLGNLDMLRRVYSKRQLLEQMVDLWSNHLHVPADEDNSWVQRKAYDDMIRAYALSTFEKLLVAATLHPAMQLYLDNYLSVKNAPNENHGRELLELHTVGKSAGYTEQMVKDSAKILSGYSVNTDTWGLYYDPNRHTNGRVTVLGFTSPNNLADGRAVTLAYLKYLAHHPATAHRVARRIATRFVSDAPSSKLVAHLAHVYLASGTDIKSVLRALIKSDEFWAAKGTKVRTPIDDLVATTRALRVTVHRPTDDDQSFAKSMAWVHGSLLLYQWPRPDGSPDDGVSWSSVSRILNSFSMHWDLAGGWWPTRAVSYRTPAYWLPARSIRLDAFVDHLSRTWLGKRSTDRLLQAVCVAINESPSAVVTADHAVIAWKFPRLAGALLDTPQHMTR